MIVCKLNLIKQNFKKEKWVKIYYEIQVRKRDLATLVQLIILLMFLKYYTEQKMYFFIHPGNNNKGGSLPGRTLLLHVLRAS